MTEQQLREMNYRECATCAAKPGAPDLCAACLANRFAVDMLAAEVRRLRGELVNSLSTGAVAGARASMKAAIAHFESKGDVAAVAELRMLLDGMR